MQPFNSRPYRAFLQTSARYLGLAAGTAETVNRNPSPAAKGLPVSSPCPGRNRSAGDAV